METRMIYYVCTKYGCTWYGLIDEMRDDYYYPQSSTWFFASEDEALQKIDEINSVN